MYKTWCQSRNATLRQRVQNLTDPIPNAHAHTGRGPHIALEKQTGLLVQRQKQPGLGLESENEQVCLDKEGWGLSEISKQIIDMGGIQKGKSTGKNQVSYLMVVQRAL